jgi:molybdopterin converting factor small subunit
LKVKVFAPAFCDLSAVDEEGYISLKEDATVNALYKKLKVPLALRPFVICTVNYEPAKLTRKLKDGDIVSMLAPISGG